MARKSRRNNISNEEVNIIQPFIQEHKLATAGYVRLSSEYSESDSVETQAMMIQQYIDDNSEYELTEIYTDVGFSGTDFDRPEFNRMMDDVRCGKIQCIIVKDLSRFGRNYIETGYYIENLLPKLNVRLISITDHFDSSKDEDVHGLQIPIKNMVNEMYAMDLSKKFIDSFERKKEAGTYKLRTLTYGYLRDKANNKLIVDPETAPIVKMIFRWFLMGYNRREISEKLNALNIPIPAATKEKNEGVKNHFSNSNWNNAIIYRIMSLPAYTGDSCIGRIVDRLYTHEKVRKVHKDDWTVHKGTHEALISQEDYALTTIGTAFSYSKDEFIRRQELSQNKDNNFNVFKKKLTCLDCQQHMRYNQKKYDCGKSFGFYKCVNDHNEGCKTEISENYLKIVVMEQIKKLMRVVCDKKSIINNLKDAIYQKGQLLSIDKKIINVKRKIADQEQTISTLYVNYNDGIIDENDLNAFMKHYSEEKTKLENLLEDYYDSRVRTKGIIERFSKLEKDFENQINMSGYNQSLVDELVNSISIDKQGNIMITFSCEDLISQFESVLTEEP